MFQPGCFSRLPRRCGRLRKNDKCDLGSSMHRECSLNMTQHENLLAIRCRMIFSLAVGKHMRMSITSSENTCSYPLSWTEAQYSLAFGKNSLVSKSGSGYFCYRARVIWVAWPLARSRDIGNNCFFLPDFSRLVLIFTSQSSQNVEEF